MTPEREFLKIRIAGGLGNQLFMFYGGLHMARHLKKRPIFDITALATISELHPGLNIHKLGLLEPYEVTKRSKASSSQYSVSLLMTRIIQKLTQHVLSGKNSKIFLPKEIGFIDPTLVGLNVIELQGYFQSWRYFMSSNDRANLLDLLETKISPWVNQTSKDLREEKPLVIHVRRGDFLKTENRNLGVLSKEYYLKIIALYPGLPVWVFTDSPEEISREFIGMDKPTKIITPPSGSDPLDSLILMSRARNLAISNSTFSWWAAMLSQSGSTIYAPEKWFEQRPDPLDLIPSNWHRIPSEWEKQ